MRPYYFVRSQYKVEVALLDLYNNIKINRFSGVPGASTVVKTLKVPIVFHYSKDFANWYSMTSSKPVLPPLPILGLRFSHREPAPSARTQPTYARQIFSQSAGIWIKDIEPTPYYYYYDLELLSDMASDWQQVAENILPYFNPFRTLRIKEFDFAPDIERKIPVFLQGVQDTIEDETSTDTQNHRFFKFKITFRLEFDLYRPFELPEMIKYAQMNMRVDDIIDQLQVWVYPDPLADQVRKPWEQVSPSIRQGFSLLKSWARTLLVVQDPNTGIPNNYEGHAVQAPLGYWYYDESIPDAARPPVVVNFKDLWLTFDANSPLAKDFSGFNRDFLVLDDSTRVYHPNLAPGAGNSATTGWEVDPTVQWDQLLTWFGSEDGLMGSPYTFQIILQFTQDAIQDTIFQYMANKATKNWKGIDIPEGAVWFDWGLQNGHLYFAFNTYGSKALSYTYISKDKLTLNKTDIYKFAFVIYEEGYSGMFGYTTNSGPMVALEAVRNN